MPPPAASLLRVLRLFKGHDKQQRGTLSLVDFVAMAAPRLEQALEMARSRADEEARDALDKRWGEQRELMEKNRSSLGTRYYRYLLIPSELTIRAYNSPVGKGLSSLCVERSVAQMKFVLK